MQPPEDLTDPSFTRGLLDDLVRGTRMSNNLPGEDQRDFANSFPAFAQGVNGANQRLAGMMSGFVAQHGGAPAQGPAGPFGALEDVSDRFDSIVGLTDRMLERVDGDLERHAAANILLKERAAAQGHAAARGKVCEGASQRAQGVKIVTQRSGDKIL